MPGQSSFSRPQQNDEGTVGGGARRRRRGKRSGPGPSQDVDDTADIPDLQEPRIPMLDVLPPEPIPSRWLDSKMKALPASTPLTPWSLFNRSSLITAVENSVTDSETAAAMKHALQLEVRHATMFLATQNNNDFDTAMNEVERFNIQNIEEGTFIDIAAANQPGSQQSGAVRRYRNAPRIFGCVTCNVRLPSRRSLEKHFLTHDKSTFMMAMCMACGFPAPTTTMLEWHVFVAHRDVARGLVSRHWPRLRRNDHNDCSFCCAQHPEVLQATCCVYPPPLVKDPSEGSNIPRTVLPPLKDPALVHPPRGFPNVCHLPCPVEACQACCCCSLHDVPLT